MIRHLATIAALLGCIVLLPGLMASARAAEQGSPTAVDGDALAIEYRVERLSFAGLPTGGAEREFERALNRFVRQGWKLDRVLEWSTTSALILLRR